MEYIPPSVFHCPACGFEPAENDARREYAHCPRCCLTAIHEADSEGTMNAAVSYSPFPFG